MLSKRIWSALVMLGFAGQLAWAVENQFFNTFMYDRITPRVRVNRKTNDPNARAPVEGRPVIALSCPRHAATTVEITWSD